MSTQLIDNILSALCAVLPKNQHSISLHAPIFEGNEWKYLKECLDSGYVSSVGKYVDVFESELSAFTGARFAVATVNGTAALHICLKLAGVLPDDEVLLPDLTFIATTNAVRYCGAIPHFVDSHERTLGVDPFKLEDYLREISEVRQDACYNRITKRPLRAVVAMHTFGHPVDIDPLDALCKRYRLALVEDAAESLGSYYKGTHTGNWGLLSSLSFNGNKTITTGGGGAVLTNDPDLAKFAKHLTTTAKIPHPWAFLHDYCGYNYRMPNINAALGCAQLEQLPAFLRKKRALAERYRTAFADVPGVSFFSEPDFAKSNYWLNAILLDPGQVHLREDVLEATNSKGIMTRPAWALMHRLSMFSDCPRMNVDVAQSIEARLINIPSSAFL